MLSCGEQSNVIFNFKSDFTILLKLVNQSQSFERTIENQQ